MANDVKFEGKERRLAKIEKCLAEYGLSSLEEARDLCLSKGIDVDAIVKGVQLLQSRAVLKLLPKHLKKSESVFRLSVSPVQLQSREMLV